MTYQHPDFTQPAELLEQIAAQGFDALPELIRIVINEAMRMERQNHLGVAPYQRSLGAAVSATASRTTPSVRVWARSPLPFPKCGRVVSSRRHWRKGCAANGR